MIGVLISGLSDGIMISFMCGCMYVCMYVRICRIKSVNNCTLLFLQITDVYVITSVF